jgi:Zyg-11 family protein
MSNLQHLSLRNLGNDVIKPSMLNQLLKSLKTNLKYLDISNCCTNKLYKIDKSSQVDESNPLPNSSFELIGLLDGLQSLAQNLNTLLMSDLTVEDIQANFKFILKLKILQKLDLSNCKEKPNVYKSPSLVLAKIAFHLKKLAWLDISGTNLIGSSLFKEEEEINYIKKKLYEDLVDEFNDYERVKLDKIETIKSDISGLMFLSNEKKRLDFLAYFCSDSSIGTRTKIPALRVASESNEKDLFNTLETYAQHADRALFLLDALNHLFELYREEFIEDKFLGGYLIMNIMEKHLNNSRIQISGSASLFYVLKYWKEENLQFPNFYLKRLILTVLNGMEEHIDENAVFFL